MAQKRLKSLKKVAWLMWTYVCDFTWGAWDLNDTEQVGVYLFAPGVLGVIKL